jgi:anaerobic selenocysteine-containing dehydrogenase
MHEHEPCSGILEHEAQSCRGVSGVERQPRAARGDHGEDCDRCLGAAPDAEADDLLAKRRDERRFATADGRARFTVNALEYPRIPRGRLLLQTLRSHDQYNTTIYGLDDRYRGIKNGRRVVLVNPEDADRLRLTDGSYVDLVSEWKDGVERRAPGFRVVHYPTARGCAAAYYPETNVLVPLDATADTSNTPASKSVVVRLEQSATD